MQQRITTQNDRSKKQAFQLDLSNTDYVFDDIEDVFCRIKEHSKDSAEESTIAKGFAEGVELTNDLKVLFPLELNELDGLVKGHVYELSVFCKFANEDGNNEDVKQVFEFVVNQAKSR